MRPDGRSKAAFRSNPDEPCYILYMAAPNFGRDRILRRDNVIEGSAAPQRRSGRSDREPSYGLRRLARGVSEEGGDSRGGEGGKAK